MATPTYEECLAAAYEEHLSAFYAAQTQHPRPIAA
jgi:hypothetical protein